MSTYRYTESIKYEENLEYKKRSSTNSAQVNKSNFSDENNDSNSDPQIVEEIEIEELSIDGICGVY